MLVLVGVALWNKRVRRDGESEPARAGSAAVPLLNANDADRPPAAYVDY